MNDKNRTLKGIKHMVYIILYITLGNHIVSKDSFSLERVMNDNIVARRSKIKVLVVMITEVVLCIIRSVKLIIVVICRELNVLFNLWGWQQGLLLHLDAENLSLSNCKLHLKLRDLIL